MKRQIIHINQEKCTGCGLCASACHEGAIGMVNGKAQLLRDDYCDGMGDCLPACPAGAITFEEREADAYNKDAVQQHKIQKEAQFHKMNDEEKTLPCGCPGTNVKMFDRNKNVESKGDGCNIDKGCDEKFTSVTSQLRQWPVQIKLAPVNAPYFHEEVSVKEIGELLYLDSGTLTPVLKTLEKKGYIKRTRSKEDERELVVKTTAAGENLKDDALAVPKSMTACVKLDSKEAKTLYSILYKLLGKQPV